MPALATYDLTKDYAVGFWRKRPYRALDTLPPPAWTLELAGPTFTMRTPEDEPALTTEDHTPEAAVWTAMAAGAARVAFFTGTGLFDRAGNLDLDPAARAGTLLAGAATVTALAGPRNCPPLQRPRPP